MDGWVNGQINGRIITVPLSFGVGVSQSRVLGFLDALSLGICELRILGPRQDGSGILASVAQRGSMNPRSPLLGSAHL